MPERPEREIRRGRKGRKKVCSFCVDRAEFIDYKDVAKLRRFISERQDSAPPCDWHLCPPPACADGGY